MKSIRLNTRQVRAAMDGTMTEIRLPIKPQPDTRHCRLDFENGVLKESSLVGGCWTVGRKMKPPCQPGDILYVREAWQEVKSYVNNETDLCYGTSWVSGYKYKADDCQQETGKWHASANMPKEAARLFLKVTEVRVERVQDHKSDSWEYDKEGLWGYSEEYRSEICKNRDSVYGLQQTRIKYFKQLWDSTIKKQDIDRYGWDANPWVWVRKFEVVKDAHQQTTTTSVEG